MSADENTTRSALLRASTPPSKELFSTLITANHILHYHNVVDAFGHISVRNPQNPQTFFISKDLAPALVSQRDDLEEYYVSDASPVNKDAPKGYAERFIHSELYKRYPQVHSVIHSHSEAVLPFGFSSIPLRPVFHMGSVMGAQVPVYDIQNHYRSSDELHSLLINQPHLGESLAAGFHPSTTMSKATSLIKNLVISQTAAPVEFPSHPTVLMRGHGFTCVGTSIREAVHRAIYTCTNARVQTTSLLLQGGYNLNLVADRLGHREESPGNAGPARQEPVKFLTERECKDSWTQLRKNLDRPWKLWCAEVKASGVYANALGDPPGA